MAGVTGTIIKVGPGCQQPSSTYYYNSTAWDLQGVSKITRIYISFENKSANRCINSLQFQYIDDEDGIIKISPVYGNGTFAGSYFELVDLSNSNPEEYIIGLKGASATAAGGVGYNLSSLTFETNYRTYGPFGHGNDERENFNFRFGPENHLAGFHGTFNNKMLTSIGVYVRRTSKPTLLHSVKAEGPN